MENEDYKKLVDWFIFGDVGTSSKSIVIHMLNFSEDTYKLFAPFDKWDRLRCIKLLKLFPKWLERLDEMKVYAGWEKQISLIKEESNIQSKIGERVFRSMMHQDGDEYRDNLQNR